MKKFPLGNNPLRIIQTTNPRLPFTVTGERGAILGQQDGRFELWSSPVKVLDNFEITAELPDYPAPITMNDRSATIAVFPDHTTITYVDAAIVVKQHMFVPRGDASATLGASVFFEIASTRPATITFRCDPQLVPEWPAPNFGHPSAAWIKIGNGGAYLLATSSPSLFGLLAMPGTEPPELTPDQPAPLPQQPLEFKLHFDPARGTDEFFPLISLVSYNAGPLTADAVAKLGQRLLETNARLPSLYAQTQQYYAHFFDDKMTIEVPDPSVEQAFRWAELAIDQSKAAYHDEIGLTAGWSASNGSARPGYGWFFGRDALWSLFAIDSYGDFSLARNALEFLIRRQRADGKIMHEFPQTADQVNWAAMPYFYAAADSTPLFIIAMNDYVGSSGDLDFLRKHWDSVTRAYAFTRAHVSDSVYDNTQGTGWVEDWLPSLPHQEIYLAALDEQSAGALSRMAKLMDDSQLSADAAHQASVIREKVLGYQQPDGFYAFSRNADGTYDPTATIFPSVAWWTGRLTLPDPDQMLARWNSAEFATDWGLRSVGALSTLYNPLSYHQGTVWPLFTGWVSMAEYRAKQALAAYQELESNINLTWTQNPGAVTELLSGEFYEPPRRSTSHQLWSSAMIVSPLIRGMLGIEPDATRHYLKIVPQLPANWDRVIVHHVALGSISIDVTMRRMSGAIAIDAITKNPQILCVSTVDALPKDPCNQPASEHHRSSIRVEPVEIIPPFVNPLPGSVTEQLKILREQYSLHELSLELEAPAQSSQHVGLRFNGPQPRALSITGAVRQGNSLDISFPSGEGYQRQAVDIRWH